MSILLQHWKKAAIDLKIEIIAPFNLTIRNNVILSANILVKDFGAVKGMLIFTDYKIIEPYQNDIVKLGYGYTIIDEPLEKEEYNKDDYIYVLSDWSWSGDSNKRPNWLID